MLRDMDVLAYNGTSDEKATSNGAGGCNLTTVTILYTPAGCGRMHPTEKSLPREIEVVPLFTKSLVRASWQLSCSDPAGWTSEPGVYAGLLGGLRPWSLFESQLLEERGRGCWSWGVGTNPTRRSAPI